MRENFRLKQQPFGLSLGVKQVGAVLAAALLILGVVFALGLGVGRKSSAGPGQPAAGSRDALARLDEPLAAKEEPPPELRAHQALTDSRSIDKTMPVPTVTMAKAAGAEEKGAPEQEVVMPPAIAAPGPVAPAQVETPARAPLQAAASASPTPAAVAAVNAAPSAPVAAQPARRAVKKAVSPAAGTPRSASLRAKPKSKGQGAYTIQIASASSRADAERLAQRLAARKPRIVTADVPGKGRWYRVQIGSYETRESARLALLSMPGVHGIVTPAR